MTITAFGGILLSAHAQTIGWWDVALVDDLQAAKLPAPAQRRGIRIGAGATLRDIAEELRVTPMTILRWERGDADPRRAHAIAYRRLLDMLRSTT